MSATFDPERHIWHITVPNNSDMLQACGRMAEVLETLPEGLPAEYKEIADQLALLPVLKDNPIYPEAALFTGRYACNFVRALGHAAETVHDGCDRRLAACLFEYFTVEGVVITGDAPGSLPLAA